MWGATTASDPFLMLKIIIFKNSVLNFINEAEDPICAELLIQNGI